VEAAAFRGVGDAVARRPAARLAGAAGLFALVALALRGALVALALRDASARPPPRVALAAFAARVPDLAFARARPAGLVAVFRFAADFFAMACPPDSLTE
jgi:hypothetical protein